MSNSPKIPRPRSHAMPYICGIAIMLILIFQMVGCKSQLERVVLPPAQVLIPVAQSCITPDQIPPKPQYAPIEGDYVQRLAAILKNRELKRAYIAKLQAIANSCAEER